VRPLAAQGSGAARPSRHARVAPARPAAENNVMRTLGPVLCAAALGLLATPALSQIYVQLPFSHPEAHVSSQPTIVLTVDPCDTQECDMTIYLETTVEEGIWVPVLRTRNTIQHSYGRLIVRQGGVWSELVRVGTAQEGKTIWQFVLPGDSIPIVSGSFAGPSHAWSAACITIPIGIDGTYVLADAHWTS